jgi:hypothetical protein
VEVGHLSGGNEEDHEILQLGWQCLDLKSK